MLVQYKADIVISSNVTCSRHDMTEILLKVALNTINQIIICNNSLAHNFRIYTLCLDIFRLGFFQREHKFYNQSQMTREMTRHYASQVCTAQRFISAVSKFGSFKNLIYCSDCNVILTIKQMIVEFRYMSFFNQCHLSNKTSVYCIELYISCVKIWRFYKSDLLADIYFRCFMKRTKNTILLGFYF